MPTLTYTDELKNRIRDYIIDHKINTKAFAKICGLSKNTLYDFLHGKRISELSLRKIARTLKDGK